MIEFVIIFPSIVFLTYIIVSGVIMYHLQKTIVKLSFMVREDHGQAYEYKDLASLNLEVDKDNEEENHEMIPLSDASPEDIMGSLRK